MHYRHHNPISILQYFISQPNATHRLNPTDFINLSIVAVIQISHHVCFTIPNPFFIIKILSQIPNSSGKSLDTMMMPLPVAANDFNIS